MKSEVVIGLFIQGIIMAVGLVAYAHANFSTKHEMESLREVINRIDERVYALATKEGIK